MPGFSAASAAVLHAKLPKLTGAAPGGAETQDVSVGGVMLLTTVAVGMAIAGAGLLAAVFLGLWWVLSLIPVPAAVTHLLHLL